MDEVTRELYELEDRFVDEVQDRAGTNQGQGAEAIANAVLGHLPVELQAKLAPVTASQALLDKAVDLYQAARPILEPPCPDASHPLASTRRAWMKLWGVVKIQKTEKMTVGQWLADDLLKFSEPMDAQAVAQMFSEYVHARLNYRSNLTADQRVGRVGSQFVSEALKNLREHEGFVDIKVACARFKKEEKAPEANLDDSELSH